ncbi:MAG: glycosyltransferase [Bacteroidetes bacterium]|nr:glycosyltransferase [Bacteroidota bacterium]
MTEVLYLSYDGMTDPLGQSQVIPYLEGLTKKGYHFHLISFEKEIPYERDKELIGNLLRSKNIEWHPLTYTKRPPVLSTLWDLYRMKSKGAGLIRKHGISLVHCRSYISGLAGLDFQQRFNIPFLFDMRGFWADERVDGKLWDVNKPIYKIVYAYFKKKEREMLFKADGVISLTENAKAEIESWKVRSTKKLPITVIPCCADLNHFNPANVTKEAIDNLRTSLNINGHPVISYLGAIGTWYMLDEMLAFFAVFLKTYPHATFLFITRERAAEIIAMAQKLDIPENAIKVMSAGRSEVPAALMLSDLSLFFIRPTYSKKASSPTKQAEIMGMGKPLLCNTGIGDTDTIVNKYHCGMAIDLSDPNAFDAAIKGMETLLKTPPEQIMAGASSYFSLDAGVSKYESVYQSMLKKV